MSRTLRIATRKSPLALWQAEHVKARLQQLHPDLVVELVGMTTRGDKILDAPLAKVGGKGLFVKELEHALLNHEADIAVHSMKDVPMEFPDGLMLGVICEREDPRDAFVSNRFASLDELPQDAVVGTSSLRRACQLKSARPDLVIESLRGNVNSRLAKLDAGDFDAIILASAGLIRLGLTARIRNAIAPEVILPAGGQGAIGIELRSNDDTTRALIAPLHHSESADRVICERALNRHLQGGCQVPIAAYAIKEGTQLWLRALVGDPDGSETLRAELRGAARDAQALGISVADELKAQGADRILAAVYGSDYGFG